MIYSVASPRGAYMESHVTPACTNQLKKVAYALDKLCPISPKNLSEGLHVCRTLQMHGIPSTLGKFSKPGDDTAEIINEYMLASTAIKSSSAANHFYLSVKPGVLDFDSDKVLEIATAALQQGHGVHFDSREHEQAEPTIRLLQEIIDLNIPADDTTCNWKFSIAMPSRWKRSIVDAQWAIDKGVRVRLVKGEFKPADSSDAMDPAKGFLELVDHFGRQRSGDSTCQPRLCVGPRGTGTLQKMLDPGSTGIDLRLAGRQDDGTCRGNGGSRQVLYSLWRCTAEVRHQIFFTKSPEAAETRPSGTFRGFQIQTG